MAFDVTFTLLDGYGRTTTRRFGNTRSTIADCLTDSATMLGLLEAISMSAVSKYSIASVVPIASPAPESEANNDAGGTIHCRMDNSKMVGLKIPAFQTNKIEADGTIDIADSDVADFVAAFGSGGYWRVSEGNYISAPVYAELDR